MAATVLIADGEPILREGLSELLAVRQDFTVVGEASTFPEAIAEARVRRPDIALLSFNLAYGGVRAAVAQIRDASPSTRIIVMVPPGYDAALRVSADAIVSYGASADRLLASIRAAWMDAKPCDSSGRVPPRSSLTPREEQVCALLARAYSNRQIQQELGICNGTVKRHVHHILLKFEVHNRVEVAIRLARSRADVGEGGSTCSNNHGCSW